MKMSGQFHTRLPYGRGNIPRYAFNMRLRGTHSGSGLFGRNEPLVLLGIYARFLGHNVKCMHLYFIVVRMTLSVAETV
jgi:hypothetical protein